MAGYQSTRGANYYATNRSMNSRFLPNHNATRHVSQINLGPVSQTVIAIFLVAVLGVLFLYQNTAVTSYDHSINSINTELADLEAERNALTVENAKIHAAAASENENTVASNMATANSSAYVAE